jgi:hypothetical protein
MARAMNAWGEWNPNGGGAGTKLGVGGLDQALGQVVLDAASIASRCRRILCCSSTKAAAALRPGDPAVQGLVCLRRRSRPGPQRRRSLTAAGRDLYPHLHTPAADWLVDDVDLWLA